MLDAKKRVIISACLLGENCRYDGKQKEVKEILKRYKEYEIIPFCPEDPLFGTPRQRISVVLVDGIKKIITDETKEDVTSKLEDEINSFISKHKDIDAIVLKSKSPSCGYKTTPILDEDKKMKLGNGIASDIFLKAYKNISIKDELTYKK